MSRDCPLILSADDDENAQFLLRRAVRRAGITAALQEVSDGQKAIEYLLGRGEFGDRTNFPLPDLLLLDLKMPVVSGFDVLHFLSGKPELKHIPVVVFSSSENQQDVQRAKELGCDDYLVKPTDFGGLVETLRMVERKYLTQPGAASVRQTPPGAGSKEKPERPALTSVPLFPPPRPRPLTESPEMFKLLIEQVQDYAIFLLDTDGYVRSWNEGARRIKGYEAQEILGKHFTLFYPRHDVETQKPDFELRLATEMGRYEEEGWRVRKDGSRFWANAVITALRTPDGALAGFAKVTRDLTTRKLQEENLQRLLESEERFRLLVEQVKDYAIFFLDAKGNISSWNQGARRIKGYTAEEIIGKHFSIFYTQEDLDSEKPRRELIIATSEGRYEEEGWRLKKDGTRFWASVVITALWDKRGNLTGFAKVTRDLTTRKIQDDALRQKNEQLEAFAHTLSHDLRAPIRSIASFADILKNEGDDISLEERRLYLSKICNAARGVEALIRGVLQLSQLSALPAIEERVPLESVLEEVQALLESQIINSKGVVEIAAPLPVLAVNRTLLVQIFSNLLANSLKFARPDQPPHISICGTARGGMAEVRVKDNGVGIPPELHGTIFDLFNRGARPASQEGLGVGLTIVKRACERVGGSVAIESAPGQGTQFTLTLPCGSESATPASVCEV